MKKYLLLIAILLMMAKGAEGQVYDTVYQRGENYYYMEWYDEMEWFYNYNDNHRYGHCLRTLGYYNTSFAVHSYVGRKYYTDRPLQVNGLACMVLSDRQSWCDSPNEIIDSLDRLPEYMYLFELDWDSTIDPLDPMQVLNTDTLNLKLLDSVRWDTVVPKVFKLPKNVDTSYGFMYCWLYEAMFDDTVMVEGDFFIAGTQRNNLLIGYGYPTHFQRVPTNYVGVYGPSRLMTSIQFNSENESFDGRWLPGTCGVYGPFNVIMTGNRLIQLHSDNDSMGTVQGEGFFPDSSTQYIEALPMEHYRFERWNDGDTTNPRAVLLTQDTSFTAYFRPTEQYELALESNDAERGSVYGAGMYAEGDTAKIWATAWRDYRFAHWNDGDTANPRWVVMTCDTSFTGIFLAQDGIEESANGQELRLVPNPASDYVVVSCGEVVEGVLVVTDLAGKEMGRYRMSGTDMKVDTQKLPAGVYYVTLTTVRGTSTQKLVVDHFR